VYLVRHAEKAGDAGQSPLTDDGVKAAKKLARILSQARIEDRDWH
jgi:phosphohistidine phosphatase SixA